MRRPVYVRFQRGYVSGARVLHPKGVCGVSRALPCSSRVEHKPLPFRLYLQTYMTRLQAASSRQHPSPFTAATMHAPFLRHTRIALACIVPGVLGGQSRPDTLPFITWAAFMGHSPLPWRARPVAHGFSALSVARESETPPSCSTSLRLSRSRCSNLRENLVCFPGARTLRNDSLPFTVYFF